MTTIENIKNLMDLELEPYKGVICKLDDSGDSRVEWDARNASEVQIARETFARYKKEGHVAYRVESSKDDPQGRRGQVLHDFDPEARRIIFRPPMQGGNA